MNVWEWVLTLPLGLAWVYLWLGHGRFWRARPLLEPSAKITPGWPDVCAVVPARDEAAVLPRTLPALLKQNYAGTLRVILADDQSSDGTGALAQEIARNLSAAPECRVMRTAALEPGWTGKLWALEQGVRSAVEQCREEARPLPKYFLFTDADILHPETQIRDLAAKAETENLDLVSLMVRLRCESFWERLLIPSFIFFFQKLYPFSRANDPRSKTAAAAGGCLLIKTDALLKIGGLAAVRSQLIDDCALAARVKGTGGKIWLGLSRATLSLRDYETLGSIWKMVARTAFTQLGRSWWALAGTVLGMFWLYVWAPVLLAAGIASGNPEKILAGGAIYLLMTLLYRPMTRFYEISPAYAGCLPVIAFLYSAMTVHSALLHARGAGGAWKGRVHRG